MLKASVIECNDSFSCTMSQEMMVLTLARSIYLWTEFEVAFINELQLFIDSLEGKNFLPCYLINNAFTVIDNGLQFCQVVAVCNLSNNISFTQNTLFIL